MIVALFIVRCVVVVVVIVVYGGTTGVTLVTGGWGDLKSVAVFNELVVIGRVGALFGNVGTVGFASVGAACVHTVVCGDVHMKAKIGKRGTTGSRAR